MDGEATTNINSASLVQVTAQSANDGFGWAAAVGDINGDGINDFAVSALYHMPDADLGIADGKVYVWIRVKFNELQQYRKRGQLQHNMG